MKKLFLVFTALCIATLIAFNQMIDARAYLTRLENIPNYIQLVTDMRNVWTSLNTNLINNLKEISNNKDVLKALGVFFTFIGQSIGGMFQTVVVIPTKFVIYVLTTIYYILPIDCYKPIDYGNVLWDIN